MIIYNEEKRNVVLLSFKEVKEKHERDNEWTVHANKDIKDEDIGFLKYIYPDLYFFKIDKH